MVVVPVSSDLLKRLQSKLLYWCIDRYQTECKESRLVQSQCSLDPQGGEGDGRGAGRRAAEGREGGEGSLAARGATKIERLLPISLPP